jgi:hypothetical protein
MDACGVSQSAPDTLKFPSGRLSLRALHVLAGTRPDRQCQQRCRPLPTVGMILRGESNLKPAPLAHRFAASGLTFSSLRKDSYQVENDESN